MGPRAFRSSSTHWYLPQLILLLLQTVLSQRLQQHKKQYAESAVNLSQGAKKGDRNQHPKKSTWSRALRSLGQTPSKVCVCYRCKTPMQVTSNMSGSRNYLLLDCLQKGNVLFMAIAICMHSILPLEVQSKICCEAMEPKYSLWITKLIKFSPKRNVAFDRIRAEESDDDLISRVGIQSFCPTRWTVRGASISSILKLHELWDECLEGNFGVKAQMSEFKPLFGLHLSKMEKVFVSTQHKIIIIEITYRP